MAQKPINEKAIIQNMTQDDLYKEIYKLPKTDLHCHLDGSLRLDTIISLIKKTGMPYPVDREQLRKLVVKDDPDFIKNSSLGDYLQAFGITTSVMQDQESLEQIAYEVAEDAAQENVRYLELRFAPILHTNRGMSLEDITSAVSEGLARAEKDFDIITGIIICAMRHYVPCGIEDNLLRSLPYGDLEDGAWLMALQTARHTVNMAKKNHRIVGFDLAGGEEDNPAKDYKKAFYTATNGLVPITVHAGEAVGAESILESVHYLHVKRIGHGTNLYKDEVLMNYFKNERIPLEVCLTSNLQTNHELFNYGKHPLGIYLNHRLRTVLCTDNRLVSNTTVSKELYIATKVFDLDLDYVKLMVMHGFNATLHNTYYPKSNNSYDKLRDFRSAVEKELKYGEVLEEINRRFDAAAAAEDKKGK